MLVYCPTIRYASIVQERLHLEQIRYDWLLAGHHGKRGIQSWSSAKEHFLLTRQEFGCKIKNPFNFCENYPQAALFQLELFLSIAYGPIQRMHNGATARLFGAPFMERQAYISNVLVQRQIIFQLHLTHIAVDLIRLQKRGSTCNMPIFRCVQYLCPCL